MTTKGQGWHGDSKGHAKAAKGQSDSMIDKAKTAITGTGAKAKKDATGKGWHGDSTGHSEAAKK